MKRGKSDSTVTIFRADQTAVDGIMKVMETVKNLTKQEWFVSDDRDYVREHIDSEGFVMVAADRETGIVGFVMIDFPGMDQRNLGSFLGLEGEALCQVAHIDSAAVLPAYRGLHLQERLIGAAEDILDQMPQYRYRMCTAHPDNVYSLRNLERREYKVLAMAYKYGGLPRCILYKAIQKQ